MADLRAKHYNKLNSMDEVNEKKKKKYGVLII